MNFISLGNVFFEGCFYRLRPVRLTERPNFTRDQVSMVACFFIYCNEHAGSKSMTSYEKWLCRVGTVQMAIITLAQTAAPAINHKGVCFHLWSVLGRLIGLLSIEKLIARLSENIET